jgi:hypothetical protein
MPILRKNNMFKLGRDVVNYLNHSVPVAHGQRAAGAKVILHVNDYENVLCGDVHSGLGNRFI